MCIRVNSTEFVKSLEKMFSAGGIDNSNLVELMSLAFEEASSAIKSDEALMQIENLADLGKLVQAVRRSGELPVYLAKIVALLFSPRKNEIAQKDDIIKLVEVECGLHFEREFLRQVEQAFSALPDLGLDEKNLSKAKMMKDAYRLGYEYERVYRGCAQCTMAAVSDITGRNNDEMFRAANGFAAGMALLGDGVCGGYSGGLLSMGMFAGRRREFFGGDKEEKDLNGILSRELHDKFIETYGTVICHNIHERIFGRAFHITKAEDKDAFELAGAHSLDKCPAVVGIASAWTCEILYDHGLIGGENL